MLHKISIDDCEQLITHSDIISYPKGTLIFQQNNPVNECLILIKGKISISYNKPNDKKFNSFLLETQISNEFNIDVFHNKNQLDFNNEYEITEISNKSIFISEFNLINKIPHSANLSTKSKCILLRLNKKNFSVSIKKQLTVLDSNIKVFILNHIKTFLNLPSFNFSTLYTTFLKVITNISDEITVKGKVVWKYFYLIYQGSCVITSQHINKLKYDKGNFIGLEALSKEESFYKYSIQPAENNTILIRFNVGDMELTSAGIEILTQLRKELLPLINKQEKIIQHYIERYGDGLSKLSSNNDKNNNIGNTNKVKRLKLLRINVNNIVNGNNSSPRLIKTTNTYISSSAKDFISKSASKIKKQNNGASMNIIINRTKTINVDSCNKKITNSFFKNSANNHKLYLKSTENEDKNVITDYNTITSSRTLKPISKMKTLLLPNATPHNETNIHTIDNKENSNCYLNTNYTVGNSMLMENISPGKERKNKGCFLLRKKKEKNIISLRKNLGDMFDNSIQKKIVGDNGNKSSHTQKIIVYYKTDNYNIPLASSLINQTVCK